MKKAVETTKTGGFTKMAEKRHMCESCPLRRYSEKHPGSIISRVWKWHTGWCPGWKAYQKSLAEE